MATCKEKSAKSRKRVTRTAHDPGNPSSYELWKSGAFSAA